MHCAVFYNILKYELTTHKTLPAVVVFPSCDQVQLACLARLVRELKPYWNPSIVAWLIYPPRLGRSIDDPKSFRQYQEYREAFQSLRSALRDTNNMFLACETEALRGIYQVLSAHDVSLIDPPKVTQHGISIGIARVQESKIHLVAMGHASANKGYSLLPDILRQVLKGNPNVKATIHGDIRGTGELGLRKVMASIKHVGPEVNVLTDTLGTESYYQLLQSADIMLLPYDPRAYADHGSGIYTEATLLGIPMVVPLGCSFAGASIRERRAVGFAEYSAQSISAAISDAIERLGDLKLNATAHANDIGRAESVIDIIVEESNLAGATDLAISPPVTAWKLTGWIKYNLAKSLGFLPI